MYEGHEVEYRWCKCRIWPFFEATVGIFGGRCRACGHPPGEKLVSKQEYLDWRENNLEDWTDGQK